MIFIEVPVLFSTTSQAEADKYEALGIEINESFEIDLCLVNVMSIDRINPINEDTSIIWIGEEGLPVQMEYKKLKDLISKCH